MRAGCRHGWRERRALLGRTRLHQLTIFGLLKPCLIFGKGGIVSRAGAVPKLELAFSPPAFLPQAFTLLALGRIVIA